MIDPKLVLIASGQNLKTPLLLYRIGQTGYNHCVVACRPKSREQSLGGLLVLDQPPKRFYLYGPSLSARKISSTTNVVGRQRETNRPWLNQPDRLCLCGRPYKYAWSWVLTIPTLELVDLCGHCARAIRYGDETERREMAERLASAERWRLAA